MSWVGSSSLFHSHQKKRKRPKRSRPFWPCCVRHEEGDCGLESAVTFFFDGCSACIMKLFSRMILSYSVPRWASRHEIWVRTISITVAPGIMVRCGIIGIYPCAVSKHAAQRADQVGEPIPNKARRVRRMSPCVGIDQGNYCATWIIGIIISSRELS